MNFIIKKLNAFIITNRDEIDTWAGIAGLIMVSVYFFWFRPSRPLWYLLLFLVSGYLFRVLDDFIGRHKDIVSTWKMVACGFDVLTFKTILSAISNFLLLGVYGIIIAAIFLELGV